MPRRLSIDWPDRGLFERRNGAPFRILAVSDQMETTLADPRTRAELGPIDLVLGCGDMRAPDLAFIADATGAPLVFVRGNHDGDSSWRHAAAHLPEPIEKQRVLSRDGLRILGLPWPGHTGHAARREERSAWRQVVRAVPAMLVAKRPVIVISHVPPEGIGDVETDPYHRGFRSYRWLLSRAHPALWLHGHTPLAAVESWHRTNGGTHVLNVTGAVLIELCPQPSPS